MFWQIETDQIALLAFLALFIAAKRAPRPGRRGRVLAAAALLCCIGLLQLAACLTGAACAAQAGRLLAAGGFGLALLACDAVIEDRRMQKRDLAIEKADRALEATLKKQAYIATHDPLTGMLNRTATFDACRALLQSRPNIEFDMIHIDVRRFRLFNAFYGAKAGDALLCSLGGQIRLAVEAFSCGVCGRIESDVFCAMVPHDSEKCEVQRARLIEYLRGYRDDFVLEPAVGEYIAAGRTQSVEAMFTRASIAAKENKAHTSAYRSVFRPEQEQALLREQSLVNDMYGAIAGEQFEVYIQPKYALRSDACYGGEALVRWAHPRHGMICPAAFIPVFEKNGFIEELDRYMWEHVCRLLRRWLDAGYDPAPISVNVSRVSMYSSRTAGCLKGLVEKYGVPARLLELELTESACMDDPLEMQNQLAELRAAGFRILMDDFGSGYSSLNTLKDFSIDVLKVDMKFLPKGENVKRAEIILASVLRMARWLDLDVIMEGVETKSEVTFLRGMGCDYIQGYYFAQPMPAAAYEQAYLAAAAHQDAAAGAGQAAQPGGEAAFARRESDEILVIEDDEMSCDILAHMLKGYKLAVFHVAEDALAYLQENFLRVGLILVDNMLPGMSGLDFLECCRQEALLQKIPKILMTVDDSVQTRVHAIRLNLVEFLVKPLEPQVVLACVQKWMHTNSDASLDSIRDTLDLLNEAAAVFRYHGRSAYMEFANAALLEQLGCAEALVCGRSYEELIGGFIHPEDVSIVRGMLDELPQKGICQAVWRMRNARTQQYLWLQVRGRLVDDLSGQIGYFTFADITEQHSMIEREQLVAQCNARLAADDNFDAVVLYGFDILQKYYGSARVYIFEFDWKAQSMSNTYELAAPGVSAEKANRQSLPISMISQWIGSFKENEAVFIDDTRLLQSDPARSAEYEVLAAQGIRSLMAVPIHYADILYGYIGVDDATQHVRDKKFLVDLTYSLSHAMHVNHLTETLHTLSYTDALTGLNNRNAYDRAFDALQSCAEGRVGVIFGDINGLKEVNDRLGHKEGDRYIRRAAGCLRAHFEKDEVFRISGDEFVVLLAGCTEPQLQACFAAMKEACTAEHGEMLSVGLAYGESPAALPELVAAAERDMYRMKREYHLRHADRRARS